MSGTEAPRTCPWCSASAPADATHCPACGAALAQHEDLGGVVIPGVTGLDPALEAIKDRPIRLKKGSPTQSVGPGAVAAGMLGGPLGLGIVGAIAAVAATEFLAAESDSDDGPKSIPLGKVGVPSELAWQALAHTETTEGDPLTHPVPEDPDAPPDAPGPDGPPDAPGPDAPLHPDPWGRD